MNRLAQETSPYLLQHAENPVDWYPWGEEALARARAEDKPILVSIGYAACHWCHVMERESFEDPRVAALMNERFVCVKVDREERPDVDAIYMDAVQAMTGRGGWPLNAFLTPAGVPFFAGTYWPPEPRHGLPAWSQVVTGVGMAWAEQREEIEEAGRRILPRLAGAASMAPAEGDLDPAALDAAVGDLPARRAPSSVRRRAAGAGGTQAPSRSSRAAVVRRKADAHSVDAFFRLGNARARQQVDRAARASRADTPSCSTMVSMIWSPIVYSGLSAVIGSWKIIAMSEPRSCASRARSSPADPRRRSGSSRVRSASRTDAGSTTP